MAVKIRLARRGRKRKPIYNVVVANSKSPRDGRFIEKLGTFNPNVHPPIINIDVEAATQWLLNGAQPTDTARTVLSKAGAMYKKHLQVGVLKGAKTQEEADAIFTEWMANRNSENEAAQEAVKQAKLDAIQADQEKGASLRKEAAEAEAKAKEEAEAAAKAAAEAKAAEEAAAEAGEEATEEPAAEEGEDKAAE
ncbi:30S ribosomal protein S16 [Algivirga pacifica]|uniref:Small ribosomal subunit protein bS16 n=1 Tax=Algivirga pacifica TaxID=1162670 RepID=A0ABP9DCD2_9BACT